MAVREWNDDIIFLRQIIAGPADKSYGIAVAKLAGLPETILKRAKGILTELELHSAKPEAMTEETSVNYSQKAQSKKSPKSQKLISPSPQMDLF